MKVLGAIITIIGPVALIIITILMALAFPSRAHAQAFPRFGYWQATPWGPQCAICSYGPARIPPGFQAPPVFDPYNYARRNQWRYLAPDREIDGGVYEK